MLFKYYDAEPKYLVNTIMENILRSLKNTPVELTALVEDVQILVDHPF